MSIESALKRLDQFMRDGTIGTAVACEIKFALREVYDSPRVVDNDAGQVTVSLSGRELRGWSYRNDEERRTKMLAAREYVEGWHDGRNS